MIPSAPLLLQRAATPNQRPWPPRLAFGAAARQAMAGRAGQGSSSRSSRSSGSTHHDHYHDHRQQSSQQRCQQRCQQLQALRHLSLSHSRFPSPPLPSPLSGHPPHRQPHPPLTPHRCRPRPSPHPPKRGADALARLPPPVPCPLTWHPGR